MKVVRIAVASALLALVLCTSALASERHMTRSSVALSNKELLLPSNYRNWVVLAPTAAGLPTQTHKNVASKLYVEPASYEQFAKTGLWPNKTVIVMELLTGKAATKGECGVMGLEAAVKDETGFPDPWSYYGIVYSHEKAEPKMAQVGCVDCENPMDAVLTMAFPTLRAVINAKPGHVTPSLL